MRAAIVLSLSLLAASPAFAETAHGAPGTTSGPAAGGSATLGTSGQATATPHMKDSLKNHGAVARVEGQGTGAGTSPKRGLSDAGAGAHKVNDE